EPRWRFLSAAQRRSPLLANGATKLAEGEDAMRITYLGHSTFYVEGGGVRLVIDPFLTGNPKAAAKAEDIKVDYVVLTHAHDDHKGDVVPIAKANDATVITTHEIAVWLGEQGVKAHGMNLGGKWPLGDGYVRAFQAFHGSGIAGGHAAGFLVRLGGISLYHAGDTSLFSDIKLLNGTEDTQDVTALSTCYNITIGSHYATE